MERTIKLRCPANKTVDLVAPEDNKLDLGFIATAFGLDPNTVKLNGHWICRGLDLVATSVTWRSLLSFFSDRGFSTGETDSDAIVVQGKPAKLGPKRKHEKASNFNGSSELAKADLVSKKRLKDSSEGLVSRIAQMSLKRKILSADLDLNDALKRMRTDEANASTPLLGVDRHKNSLNGRFHCSFSSVYGKRTRGGDMVVVASTSKRLG